MALHYTTQQIQRETHRTVAAAKNEVKNNWEWYNNLFPNGSGMPRLHYTAKVYKEINSLRPVEP